MRQIFAWIALSTMLFSTTLAGGQSLITNVPNRISMSLDGEWHYIIDPYQNGFFDYRRKPHDQRVTPDSGAYFTNSKPANTSERIEYDFDLSPTLHVPGAWGTQVPELTWYEGTLWYKKSFDLEKRDDKRYFLHFGAVNYHSHVWLNGKKLGTHAGGFTPFNFEATSALNDGGNFVVVMVDNTRNESAVPAVATDWWNHGGITRSVNLLEVPGSYIRDYQIGLSRDGSKIEGAVTVDSAATDEQVSIEIPAIGFRWSGKVDPSGSARFTVDAPNLERWHPGNPRLYEVKIASLHDEMKDRVGFRTIEARGQDILLNGEKIFLRGICMHEESPLDGTRIHSIEQARMMFAWAKELNANFIRLAHYPHNEHMSRLADELGILIWEEIPVYWAIDWPNPATLSNAQNQLTELITRDKNRASVIVWSMANETPLSEARNRFLGELVETARKLDDSRLISAAMEVRTEGFNKYLDDPFGEIVDIISFNQYHGWYGGDREDFPKLTWEIAYQKPVVVSEWGAGALYGKHGTIDTMWSEEYQAHLYRKTIAGLFNIPGLSGTTPWILADFRSPRRALPVVQDMWNRKGIIAEGGEKKMAFYILRDFYNSIEANLPDTDRIEGGGDNNE